MPQQSAAVPHLVVLAPDAISGRRIELSKDYLVVGREPTCDVRLDDPHVSRTHAALRRRGSAVYVQDLGSSGGTFVNGNPVTMTELLPGDVVTFATVQARFDAVVSPTDETHAMPTLIRPVPARPAKDAPSREEPVPGRMAQPEPAQAALRPARPVPARPVPARPVPARPVPARPVQAEPVQQRAAQAGVARYDIGRQDADVISNVGRDQYNAQVQQVVQQRDNFLRDIAATRTKARWLAWTGFLLFVVGFSLLIAADLSFLKQIGNAFHNPSAPPQITSPFGRDIGGIPSGLLGAALASAGMLLLIVGIVLHIVATSRRRRVERELPLPMPWPPHGEPPPPYREPGRAR